MQENKKLSHNAGKEFETLSTPMYMKRNSNMDFFNSKHSRRHVLKAQKGTGEINIFDITQYKILLLQQMFKIFKNYQ